MSKQSIKSESDYIINESFLAFFNQKDDKEQYGYDAVFHIADARIYMLHEKVVLRSQQGNVPKSVLYEGSKLSVNNLMQRHMRLQQRFHHDLTESHIYFIGLASLEVLFDDKVYGIDHQFGSTYFQEQCVLDFDVNENLLQLFGTKSLVGILKTTATPSDFVGYIEYHRDTLIHQRNYRYETTLATAFMHSNKFFGQALSIEKNLIDIGLLDKHDNRLIKSVQSSEDSVKEAFIQQMREYSTLWVRLLQMTISRQIKADNPLLKKLSKALFSESLYTRMKIIEDVFGYGNKTAEERQSGYIMYQHSYSHFGRQYMIVMYGSKEESWLSRGNVKKEYLNMLINLNSQLQDPVMDDLVLLGFDMSEMKPNGDVDVQMDVYHSQGSHMTELEYYLHNQLMELKANQSY